MTFATGTAGWSIPSALADVFQGEGTQLERYARVLTAAEINSSFYRPHRFATYARWAASVPDGFRFSVKIPKAITHVHRLIDVDHLVDEFAAQIDGLGEKLEVVLVQLPPSLKFDGRVAESFLAGLSKRIQAAIACEPRHASWFAEVADQCLSDRHVARVAADPAVGTDGLEPGGWPGLRYYRLHGTPRIYYSDYSEHYVRMLANRLCADTGSPRTWCIFDNTASGAAAADAVMLQEFIGRPPQRRNAGSPV